MSHPEKASVAGGSGARPGITGRTRLYAILADPIHHVKTPEVMHASFARHGIDGVMVPMHVVPSDLPRALEGLKAMRNLGGFIVTVPHKSAMPEFCDAVTEEAERIGAVNCVRREDDGRLSGAMLDGIGFVEGLRAEGIAVDGRHVLLVGAGGAACAIGFALAGAGVGELTICNRTVARAEALVARIAERHPALPLHAESSASPSGHHDIVINATSLGMRADDPLPVPEALLREGQVVAEVIMDPAETALLAAAARRGCRVHPGMPMLQRQIELMARHMGALS